MSMKGRYLKRKREFTIIKREKNYIEGGGQLLFPMPYPHVATKEAEIKL